MDKVAISTVDQDQVARAVREMLLAIGEDPDREGLSKTPHRIARMYAELLSGLQEDPKTILQAQFEEEHKEMVILRGIPFYSLCEHHLLPFHGVAHIGYVPQGKVVGISKIARVLELFARRLQMQERLTSQVADSIWNGLEADGVAVVIEAEHLCLTMRGVEKSGTKVVTSAIRGGFKGRAVTRSEFLSLLRGG